MRRLVADIFGTEIPGRIPTSSRYVCTCLSCSSQHSDIEIWAGSALTILKPPAAWPTTLKPLASTLRTYVKSTLISFKKAGINLDIVALGNEIRHGMLWPVGYVDVDVQPWSATVANFSSLATLYKAARAGVDDAIHSGVRRPEVMIHVDNGWNITLQQRWYGALIANGVPESAFDTIGVSFYPFYGYVLDPVSSPPEDIQVLRK